MTSAAAQEVSVAQVEEWLERMVHPQCSAKERQVLESTLAAFDSHRGFLFGLIAGCERASANGDVGGPFSEAARLMGALVAKNSMAKRVQRDRKKRSVSEANGAADQEERAAVERVCAIGALLEPSDKVSTQLTLLLATVCRSEARAEDDSLGGAPGIMTSLACLAATAMPVTGDAAASLHIEPRPWVQSCLSGLYGSRIPASTFARRALRCLKHCVRSCVGEVRELEAMPSTAALLYSTVGGGGGEDRFALPPSSSDIAGESSASLRDDDVFVVSSSLASRDRVLKTARDALMEGQAKRERKMSRLATVMAALATVSIKGWMRTTRNCFDKHVDETTGQAEKSQALVLCRWLRCLETLILGIKALVEVARRTAFLAAPSIDSNDGTMAVHQLASSRALLLPAFGGTSVPLVQLLAETARLCLDPKLARLSNDTLRVLVEARCVPETAAAQAVKRVASIFADDDAFDIRLLREPDRAVATVRCVGKLALEDYDEEGRQQGVASGSLIVEPDDDLDEERDPMDALCDSTTSLEINDESMATSSGGRVAKKKKEQQRADDDDDIFAQQLRRASKKSAMIESLVLETEIVQALIRRYFALSQAELRSCLSGNSEKLYAMECRAVGSSASASWNASGSLFSSFSSRRLTRESPSLADEDEEDEEDGYRVVEETRPTAEALVVSLCVRAPAVVSKAVLNLCENRSDDSFVVVDACYRAIGLVAPLLPSQGERAFISFEELWQTHLHKILSAGPQSYPPQQHPVGHDAFDFMARARCLWLVSRFRRSIFDQALSTESTDTVETGLLADVLQTSLAHANPKVFPDGRLALSAIDALCSLLETAIERHRAGAHYARRLAETARRREEARRSEDDIAIGGEKALSRSVSDDVSRRDSYALGKVWRVLSMVRDACAPIAERAVSVAFNALTPEGVLRCLQCVALCLEAATLEDFTLTVPTEDLFATNSESADEAFLTQLIAQLGHVIGGELVFRAFNFITYSGEDSSSARFAAAKLRGAVLCLLANALKAARLQGASLAVEPLRHASLSLIQTAFSLGEDQSMLADDIMALWLEALRASPCGENAAVDAQLGVVFSKLVSTPSSIVPVSPGVSLMDACALYTTSSSTTATAELDDDQSAVVAAVALDDDVITAPLLTIVQSYVLRTMGSDGGINAAAAGLALCVFCKLRAFKLRFTQSQKMMSTASGGADAYSAIHMTEDDVATVLAAFVVAELLLQTRKIAVLTDSPMFAKLMRIATVLLMPPRGTEDQNQNQKQQKQRNGGLGIGRSLRSMHEPRFDARFADARISLLSTAILEAHGDVFIACGFGPPTEDNAGSSYIDEVVRRALAQTFEHASRRTLDDLAVIASSCGCSPPPRRVFVASLAAAAALAHWRSADVAWHSLPIILRLWARCLFEISRAAARCNAASDRQAYEALQSWKLPAPDTDDHSSSRVIDAIATAARELQRDDIVHTTSLVDVAKHALMTAAKTRGGDEALLAAAEHVTPPELRAVLFKHLS